MYGYVDSIWNALIQAEILLGADWIHFGVIITFILIRNSVIGSGKSRLNRVLDVQLFY
jgi:hypothetical protein